MACVMETLILDWLLVGGGGPMHLESLLQGVSRKEFSMLGCVVGSTAFFWEPPI